MEMGLFLSRRREVQVCSVLTRFGYVECIQSGAAHRSPECGSVILAISEWE